MVQTESVFDPVEAVLRVARERPSALAVDMGSDRYTYGQFARMIEQVRSIVPDGANGAQPVVAILLNQGVEAYAAMLGSLAAGAMYVPVNPELSDNRKFAILAATQPDLILQEGDLSAVPSELADRCATFPRGAETFLSPHRVGARAYTIFTSGSTGNPKGVVITRAALGHYLTWSVGCLDLYPGRRCSQHPNIGFDLSVLDIYSTLCSGATLVPLVSHRDRMFPAQAIRERQIDTWVSVPSAVDLMVRANQLTSENLSGLQQVIFCGEALLVAHVRALRAVKPSLRILNLYGPTEATVSCTALEVTDVSGEGAYHHSISIGESIDGMQYRIDGGGSEGELLLSGRQLAEGYWQDPTRTAEMFQTDERGERVYRTGDLASSRGGQTWIVGRIDRQVKRLGYRIELGDIESQARACAGIAEAAAIYRDGKIELFVVSMDTQRDEFERALSERLSPYMRPDRITLLSSIPRNGNDKVDYQTLMKEG